MTSFAKSRAANLMATEAVAVLRLAVKRIHKYHYQEQVFIDSGTPLPEGWHWKEKSFPYVIVDAADLESNDLFR